MKRVSEEGRRWSALLACEIATWPRVTTKPMFGMLAAYRGDQIFAALPRTRALITTSGFIFKLQEGKQRTAALKDARVIAGDAPGQGWMAFELSCEADLRDAVQWLSVAYEECAAKSPKRKNMEKQ